MRKQSDDLSREGAPSQEIEKGLKIPVPTRDEVFSVFKKAAKKTPRESLLDPVQKGVEHPATSSFPAVVAKHVFVQVGLQVLRRNGVVNPSDPMLEQRPESFNRVRVNVSHDVHLLRVLDALVLIALVFNVALRRGIVGIDDRTRQNLDLFQEAFNAARSGNLNETWRNGNCTELRDLHYVVRPFKLKGSGRGVTVLYEVMSRLGVDWREMLAELGDSAIDLEVEGVYRGR